jgi:hypothetical protein
MYQLLLLLLLLVAACCCFIQRRSNLSIALEGSHICPYFQLKNGFKSSRSRDW